MNNDLFSPVESKRSIAIGPVVWGSILILVGAGWLLAALDIATIPWRAALAAVLILVGIALTATASQGQAPEGLFAAGTVLAIVLALLSTAGAAFSLPLSGGFGDRSISPTIATLEGEYRMVGGELDLSLRDVTFPEGETRPSPSTPPSLQASCSYWGRVGTVSASTRNCPIPGSMMRPDGW